MTCNSPPTLNGAGHQQMIPTNRGHFESRFSQRGPLVATNAGTYRSLMACTSKWGWAISFQLHMKNAHDSYACSGRVIVC